MTHSRHAALAVLLLGLASAAAPAAADSVDSGAEQALEDENALLRRRVEALEGRLGRLEDLETLPVAAEGDARPFEFRLSGFLKADMYWNDSRVNGTSAPRFALSIGDSDSQFTGTVQNSRFMLDLLGPHIGEGRLRGYLEMDFFNFRGEDDHNILNNEPRIRQLWIAFDQPKWRILMGETWDLFAPLNTATLNTNGNYWFGGNAGFRRPQLQGRYRFGFSGGHGLTVAASINANVGVSREEEGTIVNSGQDSGIPVFEAGVIYHIPGLFAGEAQLGVAGTWGREQFDQIDKELDQWGVGGHLVLPITEWATFKGEAQYGANLDAYLAAPGVNLVQGKSIRSTSGWAQLTLQPLDATAANLIFGIADDKDSDLPDDARSRNIVWGVNLKQTLYEHFVMGVEFQRFDTRYKAASNADANLIWFSGIMDF